MKLQVIEKKKSAYGKDMRGKEIQIYLTICNASLDLIASAGIFIGHFIKNS